MVDLLKDFFDIILHIDVYIRTWATNYQAWTYLIICLIIFCETGLVVTPFLPGDSLLFATGAVAAMDGNPINIVLVMILIFISAFGGDNTNYFIGKYLGKKVYDRNYKLIKREYLNKTHTFYEKHGGKTLIIARFMPIIRTFAPFVAGVGAMRYPRFLSFSILGNFLWVITFCLAGYFFGNIPVVKRNFTIVIFTIIILSVVPPIITVLRAKFAGAKK